MDDSNYCKKVGFSLFLGLWNRMQSQNTPDLHYRIANWLEECWTHGRRRLVMTIFRGAGKSSLTAIFVAWVLSVDPDLRILVLSAEARLARKLVRNTRKIIEKHPLTTHLTPKNPDQWAAGRFTVARTKELRTYADAALRLRRSKIKGGSKQRGLLAPL